MRAVLIDSKRRRLKRHLLGTHGSLSISDSQELMFTSANTGRPKVHIPASMIYGVQVGSGQRVQLPHSISVPSTIKRSISSSLSALSQMVGSTVGETGDDVTEDRHVTVMCLQASAPPVTKRPKHKRYTFRFESAMEALEFYHRIERLTLRKHDMVF